MHFTCLYRLHRLSYCYIVLQLYNDNKCSTQINVNDVNILRYGMSVLTVGPYRPKTAFRYLADANVLH